MDDPTLQRRLAAETRFTRLLHVSSCGSTQDLAATEPSGDLVVWADLQEAGRGRKGRAWFGAPGKDVEVTFRAAGLPVDRPLRLAPLLATAVVVALESFAGDALALDWPNDVVWRGRKLSGILLDAQSASGANGDGARGVGLLVGIGVNVNRTSFPPELLERATSLALISGRMHERDEVVLRLAQSIDGALAAFARGELAEHEACFRARLGLIGCRVRVGLVQGGTRDGVLSSLDLDELRLDDSEPLPLALVESLARQ
ncbi:MAG: biotin--[acetyl-CoA-carboxylase] ligase [Planctomycetes bacterium]|nr:biotin--[acetyl-CoA-carboxylase] ligase [Planctomycetota bacterium]